MLPAFTINPLFIKQFQLTVPGDSDGASGFEGSQQPVCACLSVNECRLFAVRRKIERTELLQGECHLSPIIYIH